MRTLWLNWLSAGPEVPDEFHAIDYPLCFNLPSRSWRQSGDTIALLRDTVRPRLHVDLLFELAHELKPSGPPCDASFVRGYLLCIGVSEGAFAAQASKDLILGERDNGVHRYYERWPEGYNLVSDLLSQRDPDELGTIELQVGETRRALSAVPRLGACEVLKFFQPFNTLAAGDLISLGSLARDIPIPALPIQVEISLHPDWRFPVRLVCDSEGGTE